MNPAPSRSSRRLSPKHLTLTWFTLLVLPVSAVGFQGETSLFCLLSHIDGLEKEAETAKRYIGESTEDIGNMHVYFTVTNGSLYAHSNLLAPGVEYPAKVVTNQDVPLLSIIDGLDRIRYGTEFDEARLPALERLMDERIKMFIDPSVLSDSRYGSLDFRGVKHLRLIDAEGFDRPMMLIPGQGGRRRAVVEYQPHVYVDPNDQGAISFLNSLKEMESVRARVTPANSAGDVGDLVTQAKDAKDYADLINNLIPDSLKIVLDPPSNNSVGQGRRTFSVYSASAADAVLASLEFLVPQPGPGGITVLGVRLSWIPVFIIVLVLLGALIRRLS